MEILGVGGFELLAIFIIMLVVAGPKRMIQWSYVLGQYIGKAKGMWAELATQLQAEFDAADAGIEVPKDIFSKNRFKADTDAALRRLTKQAQAPLTEITSELKSDLNTIKGVTQVPNARISNTAKNEKITPLPVNDFGTWGDMPEPVQKEG